MVDGQLLGVKLDSVEIEPNVHYKKDLTNIDLQAGINNEKEFEDFDSIAIQKLLVKLTFFLFYLLSLISLI